MSIFHSTEITGTVRSLLVNKNVASTIEGEPFHAVLATFSGFQGEGHGGLTRESCIRVKKQYPLGTEIRNTRQITLVSKEELEAIANAMELERRIEPQWLGANIMLEGIPAFTTVPPSSRLIFSSGASIVVDCENGPCRGPAEVIEQHHPGKGNQFVKHALSKRGVTGWIEREGLIEMGMICRLHVPPLRSYAPLQGQF